MAVILGKSHQHVASALGVGGRKSSPFFLVEQVLIDLKLPAARVHEVGLGAVIQHLAHRLGSVAGLQGNADSVAVLLKIPPPDLTSAVKPRNYHRR